MKPKLYVKTGCPWCTEAEAFLKTHTIDYERIDVLRDASAMKAMVQLSGQTKTPTLQWGGDVLADFGVDELEPFLRKQKAI